MSFLIFMKENLVQFPFFLERLPSSSFPVILEKKAFHLMPSLGVHPSFIPVIPRLLPSLCPLAPAFICLAGSFCCRELETAGNRHVDGSAETEIALGFVSNLVLFTNSIPSYLHLFLTRVSHLLPHLYSLSVPLNRCFCVCWLCIC